MDSKATVKREKNFWHVNKKLQDLGATYFSLLIFNAKNEIIYSKSSDPEWAHEFTSAGLYKKCHLLSAAHDLMKLQENSFTLAWDLYLPTTEESKELDDIRKYKDITHGVGFCIKNHDQSRAIINIGPTLRPLR